ncbi:hypothetical protein K439DRAFT_1638757 [Ramaria rubella]|nr:hypothetical protein K439DRAFT_1638757 [Ramaria rubella]
MSRFEVRQFTEESEQVHQALVDTPLTPTKSDVEKGTLPSYSTHPLNESEELVVGGRRPRWMLWIKRRRDEHRERMKKCGSAKRSKIIRAFKFLFAGWVLLSLVHFAVAGINIHKAYKSMECIAVTPSEHADGLDVTVPLNRLKAIIVHDSLSGGTSSIVHDSKVANGTVRFAVTFADGEKQDALYDGCAVQYKRNLGVGLIPREQHGKRAEISSLSIHIPVSLKDPSVVFIGGKDKHLSDKKLQKVIRWWRKRHDKQVESVD